MRERRGFSPCLRVSVSKDGHSFPTVADQRTSAKLVGVMAIPNVKRFRPYCPTCNDTFTLMAVLPRETNVDQYLADAVARHDHKAFQDAKQMHFKVRVGQQKQKKAK